MSINEIAEYLKVKESREQAYIEEKIQQSKKMKVCPRCGWQAKTSLSLCWTFRRIGSRSPCKDDKGEQQRLEVVE